MFIRKKNQTTKKQAQSIQYERQLVSDGEGLSRRFITTFFGDAINFVDQERANNMRFFVDTEGIKFGDVNLNRVIIPKKVFVEAVNEFCINKID